MRKNAFTLAEVLITLVIIGVIAAMTIPTLMGNTNNQERRTQVKKLASAITQALQLDYALYGNKPDFGAESCWQGVNDGSETCQKIARMLKNHISSPMGDPTGTGLGLITPDGHCLAVWNDNGTPGIAVALKCSGNAVADVDQFNFVIQQTGSHFTLVPQTDTGKDYLYQ